MRRRFYFIAVLFLLCMEQAAYASHTSARTITRAAQFNKGMNLSVWLESTYWFYNGSVFPDPARFTKADILQLKNLCFNTLRVPVMFEAFTKSPTNGDFDPNNAKAVSALNYLDSVIAWANLYNMNVVVDNHIADDFTDYNLQTNYGLTDANAATKATFIARVWEQVATRLSYTDPNKVMFELRNEPNVINEANLRTIYQAVISKIRTVDATHTLIVGCSGYYDGPALTNLSPYSDSDILYVFHTYEPSAATLQGAGGIDDVDSASLSPNTFGASDVTYLNNLFQSINTWSNTNQVPVVVNEFGMTTLQEVYGDTASRNNYYRTIGRLVQQYNFPWAVWDGYGPDEYSDDYGSTTRYYLFSIFDKTGTLTDAHLNPAIRSALQIGSACNSSAVDEIPNLLQCKLYPNPAGASIVIELPEAGSLEVYDLPGRLLWREEGAKQKFVVNTASFLPGLYLTRINFARGASMTARFVKQ